MSNRILALLCSAWAVCALPATAQTRRDSAAGHRLRQVVRAVDSGRVVALDSALRVHLRPDQRTGGRLERQTAGLAAMFGRSRGFVVDSVVSVAPGEAAASLRSRLTGWSEWLAVQVDAKAPHLIVRVGAPSRPLPLPARPPVRASTDAERVRALDGFMARMAAADVFSGVVLLARGDSVLAVRGYGMADRARRLPNRPGTRFRLESVTKPMTAVAVVQLVERGQLSLDDSLGKFFPDFPLREARGAVRIRHLLSHTSGLADYLRVCERVSPCPYPARSLDDFVRQVELAQRDTLLFTPGTRWVYNNSGYVLLGKIVERVSGRPFRAYLRAHVLTPAGMRDAGVQETGERPARLADGYDKVFTGAGVRYRAAPSAGPAVEVGVADNGVYATAEDVHRFLRAFFAGRLVGLPYVRLMTTPKPELGAPRWGFGFEVDPARGVVSHGGTWAGASNSFDAWTGSGYTAVVLSNYGLGRILPREYLGMLAPAR